MFLSCFLLKLPTELQIKFKLLPMASETQHDPPPRSPPELVANALALAFSWPCHLPAAPGTVTSWRLLLYGDLSYPRIRWPHFASFRSVPEGCLLRETCSDPLPKIRHPPNRFPVLLILTTIWNDHRICSLSRRLPPALQGHSLRAGPFSVSFALCPTPSGSVLCTSQALSRSLLNDCGYRSELRTQTSNI